MSSNSFVEIKYLKEFLKNSLGTEIAEYQLKSLTKPGDNYGSIIQALDVKVTENEEKYQLIHLVSKQLLTNPYLIEIFQPQLTFVKEAKFYVEIIPTIDQFENMMKIPTEEKLDIFIKCHGSRLSLNEDAEQREADSDAVLLLENIKMENYINVDRRIGFDLTAAMFIMKQLAQFHATFVAMRLVQPDLFRTKVYPHLETLNMREDDNDKSIVERICSELRYLNDLDPQLCETIKTQLRVCDELRRITKLSEDSPYTTVVHRDLWVNNVMVLKDENGAVSKMKIYDFQNYIYQSFALDLIFFLFSSVRTEVLYEYLAKLINRYCTSFLKTLQSMKCPMEDYTIDKLWDEIKKMAKIELLHAIFMVKICRADETETLNIDEITPETFFQKGEPSDSMINRWKCIIDLFEQNEFL